MGYDVSLCLDHDVLESDPTLLCPACSQILLEPQKPECGHVHCKACLKKLRRCKLCDSMIEKHTANSKAAKARDVVPVLLLSKLGNLTVRCAQHCDAVFRLKEYELHCLKQCSKSLVPCTNRPVSCDQLVPRYLMRDHLDNDCLYRPVKCNVCGFRTVYCNLYLHERSKRCAQLATRKSENEQHNAMSVKVHILFNLFILNYDCFPPLCIGSELAFCPALINNEVILQEKNGDPFVLRNGKPREAFLKFLNAESD